MILTEFLSRLSERPEIPSPLAQGLIEALLNLAVLLFVTVLAAILAYLYQDRSLEKSFRFTSFNDATVQYRRLLDTSAENISARIRLQRVRQEYPENLGVWTTFEQKVSSTEQDLADAVLDGLARIHLHNVLFRPETQKQWALMMKFYMEVRFAKQDGTTIEQSLRAYDV